MATSAFKSTTRRSSIGTPSSSGTSSSSAHRRSRSLSRFSRRPPPEEEEQEEAPVPRGRFVNTVRGSGFPEISLDDLAVELFGSADRGRSSDVSRSVVAGPSQRRGRSVSRRGADGTGTTSGSSGVGRAAPDSNSRRRRSVSVVRQQISDSESDVDLSHKYKNRANPNSFSGGNGHVPSSEKPTISNHCRSLGRSLSQKDLLKSNDGYSSQSSAVTDDEARDGRSSTNGIVKTIRAVYAQKKNEHPTGDDVNGGLYEVMRKELRHAVEEIRMELEQVMVNTNTSDNYLQSNNSDILAVSTVRRNYATKLEKSEKRKQDLLAEIVLEEQRGRELSKIVKELLPDSKNAASVEKPSRTRKRSNDRNRMSKRLSEEAEKYFEDFVSNVEDTDISSFDGERSDESSTLSGIAKPREPEKHSREAENIRSPVPCDPLPSEMDGLVLPWLQWETHNDSSPLSCKNKAKLPVTPKSLVWDSAQERMNTPSSRGSWSPGITDSPSINTGYNPASPPSRRSGFDMDEYESLKRDEDLLLERWRQQRRINSETEILQCIKWVIALLSLPSQDRAHSRIIDLGPAPFVTAEVETESDVDLSHKYRNRSNPNSFSGGNGHVPSSEKPTISNHRRSLGRSLSQKDLLKSNDGYSSQSSAVTDDEARDGRSSKNGTVKTIRTVYAQEKNEHPTGDDVNGGLYEVMRKELRHAVEEIRMELEQVMANTNTSDDYLQSNNSDILAVSTVRRNYATKLEKSEKRKQDLLAEIVLEEQRGRELSKIVKELLPDSKNAASVEKPSRTRKRSNDRNRMSKRLSEEAEKYLEDFVSNVEDTDISSFDGERSDESSTLSGTAKPREPEKHSREAENIRSPVPFDPLPSEMDGLVLPWLQWETHNDSSPLSCKNKAKLPLTPKSLVWDSAQECMNTPSSRGSWSPGITGSPSTNTGYNPASPPSRRWGFEMDEYESLKRDEDLPLERWRQQRRINSGGLLLCGNIHL